MSPPVPVQIDNTHNNDDGYTVRHSDVDGDSVIVRLCLGGLSCIVHIYPWYMLYVVICVSKQTIQLYKQLTY